MGHDADVDEEVAVFAVLYVVAGPFVGLMEKDWEGYFECRGRAVGPVEDGGGGVHGDADVGVPGQILLGRKS